MNKFLWIENSGLVVEEDLILIGSSTKKNDKTKIGQFGSGFKYALSYFMRTGTRIDIWSGKEEIKVETTPRIHRNKIVNILTVNGRETSITTEMGEVGWTGWMALREIVCNAIDEGSYKLEIEDFPFVGGREDRTVISIELTKELQDVVNNYEQYFAFDRKPTMVIKGVGRLFLKSKVSEVSVYRKGIRCMEPNKETSIIDYDFDEIEINEARVADYYTIADKIGYILHRIDDPELLLIALNHTDINLLYQYVSKENARAIAELSERGVVFVPKYLKDLVGTSVTAGAVIIQSNWYTELVAKNIIPDMLFGAQLAEGRRFVVESIMQVSEVNTILHKAGFDFKVETVRFLESNFNRAFDKHTNTLYLNKAEVECLLPRYIAAIALTRIEPSYLEKFL